MQLPPLNTPGARCRYRGRASRSNTPEGSLGEPSLPEVVAAEEPVVEDHSRILGLISNADAATVALVVRVQASYRGWIWRKQMAAFDRWDKSSGVDFLPKVAEEGAELELLPESQLLVEGQHFTPLGASQSHARARARARALALPRAHCAPS